MPGHRVHLIGGGLAGLGVAALATRFEYEAEPLTFAGLFAVTLLASIFPDLDTSSRGRIYYYLGLAAVDVLLIYYEEYRWAALLGLFAMFPAMGAHRGWTHSWWAAVLVPLPLLILPVWLFEVEPVQVLPLYAAAVTGYVSHLLMDAFL